MAYAIVMQAIPRRFSPRLTLVWMAYLLVVLLLIIAAAGPRYGQLQTLTLDATARSGQLIPSESATLATIGFSIEAYAAYFTAFELIISMVFWLLAAFLLWRRPHDRMAVLFALTFSLMGAAASPYLSGLSWQYEVLEEPLYLLQLLSWTLFVGTLFLFPEGRFVSPWAQNLFAVWCLYALLSIAIPALRYRAAILWHTPLEAALVLWIFLWIILAAGVQVYRYRRLASPVERMQSKWVVVGLALLAVFSFLGALPTFLLPASGYPQSVIMLSQLLAFSIPLVLLLLWAVMIATAVLRYRLFDIDILVRKTLLYTTITAVLAAIYAISVVFLQSASALAGAQQSTLSVVVSTLIIAAVFNPLRRRVQRQIDRRFYRRKYDAAQTLDHFANIVRDEVELETLSAALLDAIDDTMAPKSMRLWLSTNLRANEPRWRR